MKDYALKFKKLYVPYFLCMVGVVVGYTVFNWVFTIWLDWLPFNDDVTGFIAPAGVTIIAVVVFLKKGINSFKYKNDNGSFLLYIFGIFGIFIPTEMAQNYIETATGTLTELNKISDINHYPKTKYYDLKQSYFYKQGVSTYVKVEVSGKRNESLDMYVYVVTPLLDTPKDTLQNSFNYWTCIRYNKSISNRLEESEKEQKYKEFLSTTYQEYRAKSFTYNYLERLNHQKDLKYYQLALKEHPFKPKIENAIFFETQSGKFEERNGKQLKWIGIAALIALAFIALLLLAFPLKTESELMREEKRAAKERKKGWRKRYAYLLPQEGFMITPLLIYANVLLFLAMVLLGAGFMTLDYPYLLSWGGVIRQEVLQGAWWRLMTAVFLHGGLMHLLNNMFSLYFIGLFLEPLLGKWRYLIVYLICGLVASLTSIYWHEATLAVGASGAIFGMYGFVLALSLFKLFDPAKNKMMLIFASLFVGYNLILGLAGGVDNAAHIGGLCCGFFIGLLFFSSLQNEIEEDEM